jgi:hypothetical protein
LLVKLILKVVVLLCLPLFIILLKEAEEVLEPEERLHLAVIDSDRLLLSAGPS